MLPKSAFQSDAEYLAHLRDWFAGQALNGLRGVPFDELEAESVARRCYMTADAMLAARKDGAQ